MVVIAPIEELPPWQEEMRLCHLMGPVKEKEAGSVEKKYLTFSFTVNSG